MIQRTEAIRTEESKKLLNNLNKRGGKAEQPQTNHGTH